MYPHDITVVGFTSPPCTLAATDSRRLPAGHAVFVFLAEHPPEVRPCPRVVKRLLTATMHHHLNLASPTQPTPPSFSASRNLAYYCWPPSPSGATTPAPRLSHDLITDVGMPPSPSSLPSIFQGFRVYTSTPLHTISFKITKWL
ncbi:hypothetical protein L1987_15539 [Smallanthus sonchifolius]|uniref:Uncharacterized protein n=1 Tax=Smallanthus sonchifolius TaxID=185202 RepID=A0ACB9J6V4_9ASTR|nr:hypothetical protein L1987_15539 [Smallanthus sonchifolius]